MIASFWRASRTVARPGVAAETGVRQAMGRWMAKEGAVRFYSLAPPSDLGDYEKDIYKKLVESLDPEELMVKDVSGGCGSMFAISIVSKKFDGMNMVKQHRLVNEVLADDIKQWHGLQLRTKKA
ncbi:Aim1p [Sugiyamaella lignohabitans]|uniref:Aim1p n=1 Tax=Sugiyamaella lignohabitans TaxID=796027 RepID=A0A161HFU8_9ASCO|nr:Aim1p [Sugiyamaella lignohabitans]ANB11501.1 Aim1p [Sugiyamaella lignohabitans]